MKKISTVAAQKSERVEAQKLTIGLDLGDRSSWYCVLNETGGSTAGTEAGDDAESDEGSLRGDAAQPDRTGNGNAFAVGEPVVE